MRSIAGGALLALAAQAAFIAPAVAHKGEHHEAAAYSVKQVKLASVPPVPLVSMFGRAGRLDRELGADAPVLLNFVFTTCSTICSMQTAVLAELQRQATAQGRRVRLVSITIDPDNDTPEQLLRFAKSFKVQAGWEFLTGSFDDLIKVQKFFDVYRGSKGSHPAVYLLRGATKDQWVRVEGTASAEALLSLLPTVATYR